MREKKCILVIDDNIHILALCAEVLEIDDYEILTAQSADEAFSILEQKTPIDLIILDYQLEDMCGDDFLLKLDKKDKKILKKIPVVFLTGMDEIPASKAVGFIKKPFAIDQFLASVRTFIS